MAEDRSTSTQSSVTGDPTGGAVALLTFVDIALWCLTIGIWNTAAGPQKVAGWMLFVTGAGALYFGATLWLRWVGFAALPIGRPVLRRSEHAGTVASSAASPVSSAG